MLPPEIVKKMPQINKYARDLCALIVATLEYPNDRLQYVDAVYGHDIIDATRRTTAR
jgi:hypothetical protein